MGRSPRNRPQPRTPRTQPDDALRNTRPAAHSGRGRNLTSRRAESHRPKTTQESRSRTGRSPAKYGKPPPLPEPQVSPKEEGGREGACRPSFGTPCRNRTAPPAGRRPRGTDDAPPLPHTGNLRTAVTVP